MRNYCGELNRQLINQEVKVCGWVKNIRNLGSLVFLELQDISGRIQCVTTKEANPSVETLTRESTVEIVGTLLERKSINNKIKNGDLEIDIKSLKIHSISETPPLIIEEKTDALEEIRFENRYLDLRRENIQEIFKFRSKLFSVIHEFMNKNKFLYVETPILAKPTPEGARDYLVPSRVKKHNFYALPQSPQIYKQLLMVSGFDRYYQIAKCFRDEDLRSDRQPEFTQLDMELSFVEEEDIFALVEQLMKYIFKELKGIDIKTPFIRMDYDTSMLNYGCDKPDTRFDNLILDSTDIVKSSKEEVIKTMLKNNVCRTLGFEISLSRNEIDELDKTLKNSNYGSLIWVKKTGSEYSGSFSKKIEPAILDKLFAQHNIKEGYLFFNFDLAKIASVKLGVVRNLIAHQKLNLNPNQFNLLWIVNWPLYEYDEEEKRYMAAHHPFTQPQKEYHATFDTHQETARARSYDLVMNGLEIGGGSIRITDPEMQARMFASIGLAKEEYTNKFEILLNAFKYGVPPHGGIAFGLDRFCQLLLDLDNIKECIAFPKNTKAYDQTIKTPSEIDEKALFELGIALKN